ncbi:MAG: hypothetical protein CM1200mP41_16740 [Gammaproteobacteria bacterium]|nr:MAG: hypothetical protein CM1200mP41_16740 [Gammaproteobacteria bacterium]
MLLTLLFGMLNLTPMTLLPGMLKNVGGYPDTIIGYVLGLRGMGNPHRIFFYDLSQSVQSKNLLICGFACQGVAGWQLTQLGSNISLWDIALPLWLQGFGVGLLWVPLTLISFATLKPEFMAGGSGIYHFLRNMGGSIHISLSIAVVLA